MQEASHKIERAVQIAMACTSALGTLLLGLGQQSVFLPCIAILAAVASIVLTDTLAIFRLNRNLANIAALLAVCYSVSGVVIGTQDNQTALIAVANLLVYLQIVLQFQEKSLRIYWSLSVLSLLQVVVASALNLSVTFGPLLLIYLAVALTSLSLLFVFRETRRFYDQAPASFRAAEPIGPPGPPRRWPLVDSGATWTGVVGEDLARPLLGARMAWHVAAMCAITVVVTALIFFGVPRVNRNTWRASGGGATSVTGFSEEVSLGHMGRILQSNQEVMRASFRRLDSETPFRISGECYLRGATLSSYRNGNWSHEPGDGFGFRSQSLQSPPANRGRVVQAIKLDAPLRPSMAGRYSILFSTYPVYRHERHSFDLEVDRSRRQLLVDNTTLPDVVPQLRYTTRSGAFRGAHLARYTPEPLDYRYSSLSRLQADEIAALRNLISTAQSIVDEAGATTPLDKALAIERHFLFPNRYDYDLDPDVRRTRGVDPIEDFVANHRTGHCEYFASAAVLMLRSQGIPARMVVGYKSGEWNSVGSYYQFLERHAHAWVEVYLPPGAFPQNQLAEDDYIPRDSGAWLRLDPTPADFTAEAEVDEDSLTARIGDAVDYVQILWDEYVLGLNPQRQSESIYQPIVDGIARFLESLRNERAWLGRILIGATASLLGALLIGLAWALLYRRGRPSSEREDVGTLLTAPLRWLAGLLRRDAHEQPRARRAHVDFYDRLERLLFRQGLTRNTGQTQREFAAAAGGVLADQPHLQSVAGVPRRVAGAYYQVRFGNLALDSRQRQAVEQALHDLEAALSAPPAASAASAAEEKDTS